MLSEGGQMQRSTQRVVCVYEMSGAGKSTERERADSWLLMRHPERGAGLPVTPKVLFCTCERRRTVWGVAGPRVLLPQGKATARKPCFPPFLHVVATGYSQHPKGQVAPRREV